MAKHRRTIARWSVALLSVLSTACQTPEQHTPAAVSFSLPAQWSVNKEVTHRPLSSWLRELADPQLTLLVQEGLAANIDLHAAAQRVKAAQAQARITAAGRWPQLAVTPDWQHVQDFNNPSQTTFSALFNLSWELDVWGRIQAAQLGDLNDAEALEADYAAAKLSLAARVAQSYFELTEAGLQVAVTTQSVKEREIIVELVRGRFQRGLTRGLDLRLVLTDLENAKAQLAEANNAYQSSTRRLEVLLGRYPAAAIKPSTRLPQPPTALAAGLPSALLQRRPDIQSAFKRWQASDARLQSAQQALLPRISLTANAGSNTPALGELLDPRSAAWNLAFGLVQPVFTAGRLQGEIDVRQAKQTEALHQYHSVALNAFREVEQALAAESWLRAKEQALRQAVSETAASRELAVYSYRQGLIEILTLLDSYRSTLNAQSAHLAVQRQLLSNRIALYLALGGAI